MYLLDQTGTKLFKTEDCSDIMIVNDTEHIRKNRPDCKTNRVSIRAYRGTEKLPDSGAVIASYERMEDAREEFLAMVEAIGEGMKVFSFYPIQPVNPADNEHDDPEQSV